MSVGELLQECTLITSQPISMSTTVVPYCAVEGKSKGLINVGDFVNTILETVRCNF